MNLENKFADIHFSFMPIPDVILQGNQIKFLPLLIETNRYTENVAYR